MMVRTSLLVPVLLMFTLSAFAGDELCPGKRASMPLRVAYARHFVESGVEVLSVRVSIERGHGKTQDVLCRVGAAVAAKYGNEKQTMAACRRFNGNRGIKEECYSKSLLVIGLVIKP